MVICIYLAAKIEEEASIPDREGRVVYINVVEVFLREFYKKEYKANPATMPNGYPGELD